MAGEKPTPKTACPGCLEKGIRLKLSVPDLAEHMIAEHSVARCQACGILIGKFFLADVPVIYEGRVPGERRITLCQDCDAVLEERRALFLTEPSQGKVKAIVLEDGRPVFKMVGAREFYEKRGLSKHPRKRGESEL